MADRLLATRGVTHGGIEIIAEGEGAEAAILALAELVAKAIEDALADGVHDADSLNRIAKRTVGRFIGQSTRRKPVILCAVVSL